MSPFPPSGDGVAGPTGPLVAGALLDRGAGEQAGPGDLAGDLGRAGVGHLAARGDGADRVGVRGVVDVGANTPGESLEVANDDGAEAHRIASVRGIQYPQWSPDGRRLAYTAGSLFDTYQINIIGADGKNQKQLTWFQTGFVVCIAWLPDRCRM